MHLFLFIHVPLRKHAYRGPRKVWRGEGREGIQFERDKQGFEHLPTLPPATRDAERKILEIFIEQRREAETSNIESLRNF